MTTLVAPSIETTTIADAPVHSTKVTSRNQLRPLHCTAQPYAWGRLGSSSTVARMKEAQAVQEDDVEWTMQEDQPYAELWLGTHPSGMSQVTVHKDLQHTPEEVETEKRSLKDYVNEDPGLHCGNADANDLSFLLKVLSVRKVLSIQAHPDKELAEQLHKERPTVYKDPNHKPEMAIALSEKVRAMCGFRPLEEMAEHLKEYPEFRALIGEEAASKIEAVNQTDEVKSSLQAMFMGYLEAKDDAIKVHADQMLARLQGVAEPNEIQSLILQLAEQFPGDCGIFAPLIFNLVEMSKGEGLFISANEPHAYVSGEIIECMACSDNVVRAGLTPKLKDVDTLVNMLTYQAGKPAITAGDKIDACTTRYCPPVADFCMELIYVPAGQVYTIEPVNSPSVLLTTEGEASLKQDSICSLDVSFGSAAFGSAGTAVTVEAGPFGVRLTRAFTNVYL